MYVTCCQIQNKYVLNLVKIFISKKKKKKMTKMKIKINVSYQNIHSTSK